MIYITQFVQYIISQSAVTINAAFLQFSSDNPFEHKTNILQSPIKIIEQINRYLLITLAYLLRLSFRPNRRIGLLVAPNYVS